MVVFPEDIINDILLRLPSKSLGRSRCVSKYWNALITSPSFIKAHLHRSSKLCQYLFWEESKNSDMEENTVSKLKMLVSRFSESSNIDPPPAITEDFKNFKLVDSFNGILCLCAVNERASTSRIWLWNPAINDCFVVPEPRFPIASAESYCVGFGFNPLTSHLSDFKIVSVTLEYAPDEKCSLRAEIYSRRTNSWTELVGWIPKWSSSDITSNQIIYNEYICWSPYYRTYNEMRAIISFNVVSEEFHEIALADSIPSYDWGCIALLDGCVSLLAPYSTGFEVWKMNEFGNIESWSKLYDINMYPRVYSRSSFMGGRGTTCIPLGFASTYEALFWHCFFESNCAGSVHSSSNSLLLYDISTRTNKKRIRNTDRITMSFDSSFIDCCLKLYMESLIPVSCI